MNNLRKIKDNKIYYLFLLPAIIYFSVFVVYPFLLGVTISFQQYGLLGSTGFAGFDNYKYVLTDPLFYTAFKNTVFFSAVNVTLIILISLMTAIILSETIFKRARVFLQTVIYVPKLLSSVIIVGLFSNLLNAGGLFSDLFYQLGITQMPVNLMAEVSLAKPIFIVIAVWREIGYYVIIFTAAIIAIDPVLYEAGAVEGATWWQKTKYITIPSVSRTTKMLTLLALMSTFKTFSLAFLLQTPTNHDEIITLMLYVYEKGILQFNLGVSVAAAIIVFIFTLTVTTVVKRILRY